MLTNSDVFCRFVDCVLLNTLDNLSWLCKLNELCIIYNCFHIEFKSLTIGFCILKLVEVSHKPDSRCWIELFPNIFEGLWVFLWIKVSDLSAINSKFCHTGILSQLFIDFIPVFARNNLSILFVELLLVFLYYFGTFLWQSFDHPLCII